jgi:hypothetical protein
MSGERLNYFFVTVINPDKSKMSGERLNYFVVTVINPDKNVRITIKLFCRYCYKP